MGAVNGIAPDGSLVKTNEQVEEVWTGTTLLLQRMLGDGLKDEAYRTAWGLYHTSYETKGYWFRIRKLGTFPEYRAPCTCARGHLAMEMTRPPAK